MIFVAGTPPAPVHTIMSISERVTRGLSLWLITAVALTTVGWTAAPRAGSFCSPQDHPCAPMASRTCCCLSSPGPADAARLIVAAPPTGTPSHGPLMDIQPTSCCASPSAATWPHGSRHADLRLLYKRLLI
jgi:hypothetical protein